MNHLLIGTGDKTARLLEITKPGFLLIDDGPIADAFEQHFRVRTFNPTEHSFNPLSGIDYKRARDFAAAVYTASPQGENTLTVRNGKRALAKALLDGSQRLDKLTTQDEEVAATIDDLLLSPILRHVLCRPSNFRLTGSVVARLDRAVLGDFDAFLLAALLIGQVKGQLIVPDFGFYGRDMHTSLIRQNRLTAGLNFLDEVPDKLRSTLLSIKDKHISETTYKDAETLAKYARLEPGTRGFADFVQEAVG